MIESTSLSIEDLPERVIWRFNGCVQKGPDCWLYQGPKTAQGYGRVNWRDSGEYNSVGAHRLSYALHKEPLQEGQLLLHSCDTPLCVNPEHLRVGSQRENIADKLRSGRQAKGSRNGQAKLSESQASEIRANRDRLNISQLARKFGVSRPTIKRILRGDGWRHVA